MKSRLAVLIVLAFSVLAAAAVPANASKNLYLAAGDNGPNAAALAFSLSADGTPSPLQTITEAGGGYFNAISMSPNGKFVFMVDYSKNEIRSYTVGADGKLTNSPGSPTIPAGDPGPYGSAVTPDGKFLIVGLYDQHGVQAFTIGANGSLSAAPGGPVEVDPGAFPYSVAVSTDSRTVYLPNYTGDEVYVLRIAADGTLTELPASPVAAGDDPYHAAVTPDGKFLYVTNQLSNDVSGYSLGADGTPTPLTGSPFPVMSDVYGGLAISPNGKKLYSSGSDQIQSASIGSNGALTAGPTTLISNYNAPLALNPAGTRLYNGVDESSVDSRLLTFSVRASGALLPFGDPLPLDASLTPDSDSLVVTPAQPPVAALTAKSGSKGTVSFDASGSTDPDGSIASYAWDFGDGQTATTTTPTTSHSYAKDGKFPATVTLTDSDNCSTEMVFTGRSAYCNGSEVAKAATTAVADRQVSGAKVTAAKTQKQKGSKVLIKVKAGATENVTLQAKGSVKYKGLRGKVGLKTFNGKTSARKYRTLNLRPQKGARATAGRKGNAVITVKLTDEVGNSLTRTVRVKVVPTKRKK